MPFEDVLRFRDLMPEIPLMNDGTAIDIYADAVGTLEIMGQNFRTTYVTFTQADGQVRRLIVARIVRPMSSLLNAPGLRQAFNLPENAAPIQMN